MTGLWNQLIADSAIVGSMGLNEWLILLHARAKTLTSVAESRRL